ncbi:MAG: SDR family NAD(P)-dependent oxidoreductase [Candidatus Binatia bacterium]
MASEQRIDLSGKVAVVTGAGRGIGAAMAAAFAEAGANLVVADLNIEAAQETAHRLTALGRKVIASRTDVGVGLDVSQLFDMVQSEYGGLDILVNNAGIWFRKPFLEISDSEWDKVLTTNLKGSFLCTQQAARMMMARMSGCIINIASHAGLFYSRGQGVHYAVSKAGIIQMTRVLAFELGPFQIRVNAIAPGGINTESPTARTPEATGDLDGAVAGRETQSNPLGRRGEPEDISAAALFLASPMASFITGQTLIVNGGSIGSS